MTDTGGTTVPKRSSKQHQQDVAAEHATPKRNVAEEDATHAQVVGREDELHTDALRRAQLRRDVAEDFNRELADFLATNRLYHLELRPLEAWSLMAQLQQLHVLAPDPKSPSRALATRIARELERQILEVAGRDGTLALVASLGWRGPGEPAEDVPR